jgi:hypothetical protein
MGLQDKGYIGGKNELFDQGLGRSKSLYENRNLRF